jgi:hypothetical protein
LKITRSVTGFQVDSFSLAVSRLYPLIIHRAGLKDSGLSKEGAMKPSALKSAGCCKG